MRGTAAFVAIEIGQPLLNAMGNGWLVRPPSSASRLGSLKRQFTGWAIVLAVCHLVLVFVSLRGQSFRHKAIDREETRELNTK